MTPTAAAFCDGFVRYTIKVSPRRNMPPNSGTRIATWPNCSSNVLAGLTVATPSDVERPVGIALRTNKAITATARATLVNRFHAFILDPRSAARLRLHDRYA